MPGMTWTGDADRKLLLSILKNHKDVKVDCDSVAKDLSDGTNTCTPGAVYERLKKLKAMSKPKDGSTPPSATKRSAGDDFEDTPTKKPKASTKKTPRKTKAEVKTEDISGEETAAGDVFKMEEIET